MLGCIYLLICFFIGYSIIYFAMPGLFEFTEKTYGARQIKMPSFLIIFPAAMLMGTLVVSWLTYIAAYLLRNNNPALKPACLIVFLVGLVAIALIFINVKKDYYTKMAGMFKNFTPMDIVVTAISFFMAAFLMIYSFQYRNGQYYVGFSVYGDFAVHLDMIRSFSNGNNFPTSYSHYAGTDVKYHFMFQFLAGVLEYLGLRLDLAFNIPSIIFFAGASVLLYLLAVKLFRSKVVGLLSVIFFYFRSSPSVFRFMKENGGSLREILSALKNNQAYVGYTPNEDWGLYNLNVYGNQRHYAFGLTMVLFIVLVMLENCFALMARVRRKNKEIKLGDWFEKAFFDKKSWLPESYIKPVVIGLVIGFSGFYNGACVIAGLLVLFILAFIADRRLEYLIVAAIAFVVVKLETAFFINGSGFSFRWEPGYLSEDKSFIGILVFLASLLGFFILFLIIESVMLDGYYRWILVAFITPVIFALTIQLTVDVNVNHKYVILGCALGNVFVAALISKLLYKKSIYKRVIAALMIFVMTATGIYDFYGYIQQNNPWDQNQMVFSDNDPLTEWIIDNSTADDIYLTPIYSINRVTFAGAMLYYGWPYYAWSAGYDMDARETQVKLMYEAGDSRTLKKLCENNNIRYIIVDEEARESEDYKVNEKVISSTYGLVYTEGSGKTKINIYDTYEALK